MSTVVPRYRSVALDVDSTLVGIEGVDWLAGLRGGDVGERIAALTEKSMRGEIPLDSVYGERLAIVAPSALELEALADAYTQALAPDAARVIMRLRDDGVRVVLISGGLRQAILPLAERLGFGASDVNAVTVMFDPDGSYAGFDAESPLTTQEGKGMVLSSLDLARPILAVGDGSTDLSMKGIADTFVAFVGFVHRAPVVAGADHVVATFSELEELILS